MYTWPVLHCYPPLKQNPSLPPPPSPKGKQSCFVLAINTCTLYTCTIKLKISVIPPSLTHTIIVSKNDIYTMTLIINPPIPSLVIICVDYDMTLIFKSTCCLECFFFLNFISWNAHIGEIGTIGSTRGRWLTRMGF